ncbi:sugar phosphate isomerase family [Kineococcus sp. SYSU DK002]|uniref:hypothetical protein n=1 Tax=Kineococcus sp. SYSU DK002 TaxID=3383123 RepID=UPI003D7EB6A8
MTITTNSRTTAAELLLRPNPRALMTGGTVRPHSLELVGSSAGSAFASVNVDVTIPGADDVSAGVEPQRVKGGGPHQRGHDPSLSAGRRGDRFSEDPPQHVSQSHRGQ